MPAPSPRRETLALALFENGNVKMDPAGHRLKLHEENPDAPMSPYFFDLRTPDNPKPGSHTLTDELVREIGYEMFALLVEDGVEFDAVAGAPVAGNPFARVMANEAELTLVELMKEEAGGKRRISGVVQSDALDRLVEVVLVDDLITGAHTKREAISVMRERTLNVRHVVVLIDREQGGKEALAAEGITLHAVFTVSKLIDIYYTHGKITAAQYGAAQVYLANERPK